jgi:hypothetical protein
MSAWRCKVDEAELGPLSFQQLAELVREGKVTDKALVCREGVGKWEPAWHVPGLLRAAGIVEPGDSPPVEESGFGVQGSDTNEALTPALSQREREMGLPGYVPAMAQPPMVTLTEVIRGAIAAAVGLLAVGFFYRWAYQASLAFPMKPTLVDGELIDCYFPLVGRCTTLECGLLYVDVFAVAAVATWYAVGKRGDHESHE